MAADWQILEQPSEIVAPRLLGCELVRTTDKGTIRVRIVETEAYDQTDTASHSFKGITPRTEVMFGPAGFLYVYFTYGMHYCCNVVTGKVGEGSAVLIRAVEPIEGEALIRSRRNVDQLIDTTNGPAKLCQALDIDKTMNGHDLRAGELQLKLHDPILPNDIVQTTRIGISQAKDVPWQFYIKNNPYVSKSR